MATRVVGGPAEGLVITAQYTLAGYTAATYPARARASSSNSFASTS